MESKTRTNVVLVSQNIKIHDQVKKSLDEELYDILNFYDCHNLIRESLVNAKSWNVVIIDQFFGQISSIGFIKKLKSNFPSLPLVIIGSDNVFMSHVLDLNFINVNFLLRPIDLNFLEKQIDYVLSGDSLNESSLDDPIVIPKSDQGDRPIGQCPKFKLILKIADRVAPSLANILLFGESGTGKEIFANYIHNQSHRSKGPFVAVNCSSVPENLFESEFFGHTKGSFTGASSDRLGLFEAAKNGTLFLDEIGDLSLNHQAKILRVLQEKQIKKVGENDVVEVNCRLISATHKNLAKEVLEGRFREDLFFRLNVIPIYLPSLRDRKDDVILFANQFLKKFALINHSKAKFFSQEALSYLTENKWRGNIRELENSVERGVIMSKGITIELEDLIMSSHDGSNLNQHKDLYHNADQGHDQNKDQGHVFCVPYSEDLPTLERVITQYIAYAVDQNNGAKDKTAKEIGIDRKTLYKRVQN